MFDSPFVLFSLLIAIVAFIVARKALNQAAMLRARLDAMEAAAWQARPVAPPLTPLETPEQTPAASSPGVASEQPATAAAGESVAPVAQDQDTTAKDAAAGAAAMPPPLPQAQPGFEERIGTRWVVWIGGLTLALGGFFMVRYSIEAGLLGPGVRTLLGGAFALALLAAGEWTRRKESISAIEALPIANIPAILTAAGTAVAFATVYAAYALYGFLAPATAFILLGHGGAGHARRRAAARAGAGRSRRRRRLRHPDPGFLGKARLLGALHLSRDRHRGGVRPGADQAVALARRHHHRVRAALDLPLPAMRPVDGRTARVPRHGGICPRRLAGGLRLHVRPAGGRRPDRADLVGIARGLSARRNHDRAREFSCRHRDHRLRGSGGRHVDRGMARAGRHRRGWRRGRVRLHRVRRMGGARQSGHAGAAGRPAARHRPRSHRRFRHACI